MAFVDQRAFVCSWIHPLGIGLLCATMAGCTGFGHALSLPGVSPTPPSEAQRAKLARIALVMVDDRGPERLAGPRDKVDYIVATAVLGGVWVLGAAKGSGPAGQVAVQVGSAAGDTAQAAIVAIDPDRAKAIAREVYPTFSLDRIRDLLLETAGQPEFSRRGEIRIAPVAVSANLAGDRKVLLPYLESRGFDGGLLVSVERYALLGFATTAGTENLFLSLGISARLFDARTGEEVYSNRWHEVAPPRVYPEWSQDNFQAVRSDSDVATRKAAQSMFTEAFQLVEFRHVDVAKDADGFVVRHETPDRVPLPGFVFTKACGLRPDIHLLLKGDILERRGDFWTAIPIIRRVFVDSLRPAMRWEPFPRPEDWSSVNGFMLNEITDIEYDLRIWDGILPGIPPVLIYERKGLKEPGHVLEQPLLPEHEYSWSVRARFRWHGERRTTVWSSLSFGDCRSADTPPDGSTSMYRIATPPVAPSR